MNSLESLVNKLHLPTLQNICHHCLIQWNWICESIQEKAMKFCLCQHEKVVLIFQKLDLPLLTYTEPIRFVGTNIYGCFRPLLIETVLVLPNSVSVDANDYLLWIFYHYTEFHEHYNTPNYPWSSLLRMLYILFAQRNKCLYSSFNYGYLYVCFDLRAALAWSRPSLFIFSALVNWI